MNTDLYLFSEALDMIGKILVSYTAIAVHHRFRKEHKIDNKVFATMRTEMILGLFGIVLFIVSFAFKVVELG